MQLGSCVAMAVAAAVLIQPLAWKLPCAIKKKKKMDKLDFIKILNVCTSKDIIEKMNKQDIMGKRTHNT